VLTISAPETSIVVGKPVEVQVTIENSSGTDLSILKSRASQSGELTYDVAVVAATGAPVTLTPYGRALHGLPTDPPILIRGSDYTPTLKPHEKIVDTILLNKIHELTPGRYIVRVRKLTKSKADNVVSNTLQLTILSH
jgi:hypothetical protein